jgi:tRNA threonylcarbamoyladenosine biosynthesis protein TsaB
MMKRMRWMLALDTCGAAGGVALVELVAAEPGYRLAAERVLPGRETQEQLMLSIGEVLAAEGLAPADLDVLGVVTGPGSFTGVRIGLAAVKGLAEALDVPVVAVSRLAVLAASVPADPTHRVALNGTPGVVEVPVVEAWMDAGRGDVFVGRYAGRVSLYEAMLTGMDAAGRRVVDETLVVMEEALAERAVGAILVPSVGVREAVPLFVDRVGGGAFADTALLDANYLRVPDAELARLRALAMA